MRPRAKKSTASTPRTRFSVPQRGFALGQTCWPDVTLCEHPGCERFGTFGFGRSLLRDLPGRTFCREHRPEEFLP